MEQIICLADRPWSSIPGRTQQLMSRLKQADILYFAPDSPAGEQRVRSNITVYGLPQLPQLPQLTGVELRRQGRFIARTAARRRFTAPLLWTTHPRQVQLLDALPHEGVIYDCFQEWADQPSQWEGALARAADLVFAASPELADRLSPCSDNIALLPNGVTYPLFSGDDRPAPPMASGPVLGFAGALTDDLDLSPIFTPLASVPIGPSSFWGRTGAPPFSPGFVSCPTSKQRDPFRCQRCPITCSAATFCST